MIKLNVTDLENYRYWKANEDSTLEDLLKEFAPDKEETEPMKRGSAFHSLLENCPAEAATLEGAEVDGYYFVFDVEAAIEIPTVRELKGSYVFNTPSGLVQVVGKVDGLNGVSVHDYKLTERFDAERYLDSLQWRAYLMMFNARRFIYDVFVYGENKGRLVVREYHRLPFYAYPDMWKDVDRAVCELAEIVGQYCPQRIIQAA